MSAESVESLHHAIKRGDTLHIAHYLESGGDANRRGKFGTTLLMFAAREGQTPIIERGALVPDDAAGMPLLGLLRHYGAKRQRIIALLQARASTSNHP